MRLVRRIVFAISLVVLVSGGIAAVVLPGPQHMLCVTCHGLVKIAPKTYVEASTSASQRTAILAKLSTAREKTAAFFGELRSRPLIVVCQSEACRRIFGATGAKGIAYGWHAVLLAHSRIFGVIATHELVHIELHWRMGISGWLRGTVPAWFDEGLAVVVSEDPRFRRDSPVRAVRDVMTVNSFVGAWSAHARRVGWRTAYGAASTRVRQLERAIGRNGLRRFVDRLVRDGDIHKLLQRARSGQSI